MRFVPAVLCLCSVWAAVPNVHVPLYVETSKPLPELGTGTLVVTFSEISFDLAEQSSQKRKASWELMSSLADVKPLNEYASLQQCFLRKGADTEETHILCSCQSAHSSVKSLVMTFTPDKGRQTQSCDSSCASCSQFPTRCLACAPHFIPVSHLPGSCVDTCDVSCKRCEHAATLCAECATGYMPMFSLPGYCTASCHKSCTACASDSSMRCQSCAVGYEPVMALPGQCALKCGSSCRYCIETPDSCTVCAEGLVPSERLPGACQPSCDKSCASCSYSATVCSECATGYSAVSDLPGTCVLG